MVKINGDRPGVPEKKSLWQRLFGDKTASETPMKSDPIAGQPAWILVLIDREPPDGRASYLRRLLGNMAPGYPLSRASLEVNSDHRNPSEINSAMLALLRRPEFADSGTYNGQVRSFRAEDGISGTVVSLFPDSPPAP